ncbi:unnamed protein product [Rotaria sordida]|uniref:Calpain catalytic domain-containing protein n=1 Tax=Rotaria sordida TaxID=392033 RepID=A0A813QYZ0_9BILA|nr:unnamed protein product [Rotaria sordida]CAF1268987.1 unnamed protein product [Rotaria sordida]
MGETILHSYKNQIYSDLVRQHNFNNLFHDPEFPNNKSSLYYTSGFNRTLDNVIWKRPYEICSNPQFIVKEANRLDLDQGQLGNCWFISAVSMITQNGTIFERVCPLDQTYDKRYYAGIFHFRFWQFGKWVDVVIDDYLPTINNRLIFCQNIKEPNEFWAPLLEKAYAKLSYSYEGTDAGQTTDALIDMTGGIEESFNTKDIKDKDQFWQTIGTALKHDAMIGCSISPDPIEREAKMPNGLVKGHAYAVTAAVRVKLTNGEVVQIIRCRNPWGNEVEWRGAWSDEDKVHWNTVDPYTREQLRYKKQADGEFWMPYSDWLKQFEQIQICNLSPDSFQGQLTMQQGKHITWHQTQFDGAWIKGKTAGGCGQPNIENFFINPQYLINVTKTDIERGDGLCTVICSCLQKYTRQKRQQTAGQQAEEYINLRLYRIKDSIDVSQITQDYKFYPKDLERQGDTGPYITKREVTGRFRVKPGNYILIPSTYEQDREGQFLIRIFSEGESTGKSLNMEHQHIDPPSPITRKEKYEFHDGKSQNQKFTIIQWYDKLPATQRKLLKYGGYATVSVGFLCCLGYCGKKYCCTNKHENSQSSSIKNRNKNYIF